jgi:hypothetical protein
MSLTRAAHGLVQPAGSSSQIRRINQRDRYAGLFFAHINRL